MRLAFLFLSLTQVVLAQFAPPVGQAGTSAMNKDSSAFIAWANFCLVQRGLQDISNSSGPLANVGDSSKAIGIADNGIVSLGDGGIAICTFQQPITNGQGNDFAVFENSFSDDYLEFGFVEVSSDGVNFFRFPATCNIQDTVQTGSFGLSDATLVNNLAGKYRVLYGTPFDLNELAGTTGLDVNHVTHVKIIDVVGSINVQYATHDKNNNKINEPWPTAFGSSGFDLDAVGVIHNTTNSIAENNSEENISVYPNPSNGSTNVRVKGVKEVQGTRYEVCIMNVFGEIARASDFVPQTSQVDISNLNSGIYFLQVKTETGLFTKKIIISQ